MYVVFNDCCVILIYFGQANDKKALTPVRTLQQVLELTFNDDSVRDGSETPFTPAMSLFQSNLPVRRTVDLGRLISLIYCPGIHGEESQCLARDLTRLVSLLALFVIAVLAS